MSSVRKIIVTALVAVAALAVALTITACGSVTLTGISITTPPSVTNYVVGDVFDTDGMVVTAEYDDGTTKEVTDYTVSPSKFDKAGKQTVTISYEGKTATVEVTVNEVELTTLEVTGTLEKTTYNAGETFSADGLAVKATYSNESVDEAFEGATFEFSKTGTGDWSETLSLDKGDTKVYVRAVSGDVTSAAKEFAVTVNVPAESVTIEGESLTLYVGNGTEKNTAKLTATTDPTDTTDSVTWEIVSGNEFISLDGSTVTAIKAGEAEVRATAGDKSDTIAITVKDNAIDSVSVTGVNVSGDYIEGQTLSASSVTANVTANYSDGTSGTLNADRYSFEVSLNGSDWTNSVTLPAGEVTVHVRVSIKDSTIVHTTTTTVNVAEKKLLSIEVTTLPKDTNYLIGESLDKTGMVVTATYDNGSTEAVTGYTVSPEKFDTAGDAVTVTIEYQGKTAEFTVKVSEVGVTALEITGTPNKLTYNAGETFSADGLAVKAAYNNGSVDEAFGGATFEFSKTGTGDWSETLSLDKGDTKVYVRAVSGDVTSAAKEFAVTVNVPAESVTIEGESLTLYVGNGTEKNTAKLTATTDPTDTTDSVTWEIVSGNEFISLDGSTVTAIKAGEATIKVTAGSASDTITIVVKNNDVIDIDIIGATTDYFHGDKFVSDGMGIVVHYADGSASEVLYTGYTVKENDVIITTETVLGAGEHTITVSYSDNGTTVENTFTINVYAITGVTVSGEAYIVDAAGTSIDDGYVSEVMNGRTVTAEYGGSVNGQNTRVLTGEAYNVTVNGQTLGIGKASEIVVTPVVADSDYSTVTAKIYIAASSQLEAEDAVITGAGNAAAENGYKHAGNFQVYRNGEGENSALTFEFYSSYSGEADLIMNVANGYLLGTGTTSSDSVWMGDLPVNKVMDIYVNDNDMTSGAVNINDVTLPEAAGVPYDNFASLYVNFNAYNLARINVTEGVNTIRIQLKADESIGDTLWGAPPLVNIDWIRINPVTENEMAGLKFESDEIIYTNEGDQNATRLIAKSYNKLIAIYSDGIVNTISSDSFALTPVGGGDPVSDLDKILENDGTQYTMTATESGLTANAILKTEYLLQAESAVLENCSITEGWYVGYISNGSTITFNVNVHDEGSYKLLVCIANGNQQGDIMEEINFYDVVDISVNGGTLAKDEGVKLDRVDSVNWYAFVVKNVGTIDINASGNVEIKFTFKVGCNLDWIQLQY